jgi:hypothetical protein
VAGSVGAESNADEFMALADATDYALEHDLSQHDDQ